MDTKQLKQKILDLAIRGKLVPQDPNDEPASVLLERIRKEKEQLIASGKLKKTKSKTTDTPHYENVPFEIPASWEWVRLEELCSIKGGKRIPKGKSFSSHPTKHIYIRVTDMKKNTILDNDLQYIDEEVFTEICNYTIKKEDLYLTIAGTIGAVGEVPDLFDGMNLTENAAKLTHIQCDKKYLMYALLSTSAQDHFKSKFHQVAQPKLSIETASSTPIALPPLTEQKRIVAEIEKWFSIIDEIEANKQDLQEYIKQAKSKVLDLAIHGKLVPQDPNDEPAIELLKRINPHFVPCDTSHYENLPSGWVVTPMQKICDLAEGEKQTGIDRIYLDVKYLRGKVERVIAQNGKYVPAGSTMILVDGENSGEIFTTPVEGYQGSTFKLLDISDEMYKPFILYVIKSYQKQFRENKVGSAIPHLNKKLFREIEVFMPPFDEQKRIVKKIDEIFETIDKITAEL